MTLILVPKPVPPGERVVVGERYANPACDRCLRESSDRNPVLISKPRPSYDLREAIRGVTRRDALCIECGQILKGQR